MLTFRQKEYYIELLRYYNEFSRFGRFLHSSKDVSSLSNFTFHEFEVLSRLITDLIESNCPEDIRSMLEKYGK